MPSFPSVFGSFTKKLNTAKEVESFPVHTVSEPPKDPSQIGVQRLDFESFGLPEYKFKYALVLDNVFTREDCERLYSSTGGSLFDNFSGNWEVAQINAGGDKQYLDTSYRNSERIMVDDHSVADWILEKIRPYLKEIELLDHTNRHYVPMEEQARARAKLAGLNERLRFLKYVPGCFFKRHCDGLYRTPDTKQASYYTLQIYLNGDGGTLLGGSTRIFSRMDAWESRLDAPLRGPCIDVPARMGRVLVFEQDNILHSGEPVRDGVKVSMRTDFMYEVVYVDEVANSVDSGFIPTIPTTGSYVENQL